MPKFKNAEVNWKIIEWLKIIEPKIFWDERWFFYESYSKKDFEENWINVEFVQDNHSKSQKWVLRWLHFQFENSQDKLVRVVKWSVYDFAVDIRKWSSTFWKYFWILLSEENKKQFFIPKWFAHWFLSLENDTEFLYKCSDVYNPEGEWWYSFFDKNFWINLDEILEKFWIKKEEILLSEKDKKYDEFNEKKIFFEYKK